MSAGALLLIGGSEDRLHQKQILARFVALSGGANASIVVMTAASRAGDRIWTAYDQAFGALGVQQRRPLHIDSRAQAGDAALLAAVSAADGIYLSGGDQNRLLALTGGTALHAAIRSALLRGACVAGTSAGASAMSARMIADGKTGPRPQKGVVGLADGLGLVPHAVIDQHFSERQRLARLLSVVAEHPHLLGVGIDEDTALQIGGDGAIDVVGAGAVTLVDGRALVSNLADIADDATPSLLDVRLHLLAAGSRYLAVASPETGAGADAARGLLAGVIALLGSVAGAAHATAQATLPGPAA